MSKPSLGSAGGAGFCSAVWLLPSAVRFTQGAVCAHCSAAGVWLLPTGHTAVPRTESPWLRVGHMGRVSPQPWCKETFPGHSWVPPARPGLSPLVTGRMLSCLEQRQARSSRGELTLPAQHHGALLCLLPTSLPADPAGMPPQPSPPGRDTFGLVLLAHSSATFTGVISTHPGIGLPTGLI